jgi:lactate dehydrogenase-like 2-hydroxyacid dehydrogenase
LAAKLASKAAMTKVLVTRRLPDAVEAHLAERYDTTLNPEDLPLSQAELHQAFQDYDVVLPAITDRIGADLFQGPRRVKLIANYGVGVNHIDAEAARAAGVLVSNTPDVLTDATAELAITLMLAAARRAGEGERELRGGRWGAWKPTHMLGVQVTGKSFGVVGFGRIGQAAARKAHFGFGMPVLYHSRKRVAPEVEAETGARYCETLEALMAEADFVSLHMPGGAGTDHLIDAALIARMKPTAFLINTARGSVVDEAALAEALKAGAIAGAGLDVFEREPEVTPALLECENAVLLPHMGSATLETRTAMGMRAAENIARFVAGEPLRDPV